MPVPAPVLFSSASRGTSSQPTSANDHFGQFVAAARSGLSTPAAISGQFASSSQCSDCPNCPRSTSSAPPPRPPSLPTLLPAQASVDVFSLSSPLPRFGGASPIALGESSAFGHATPEPAPVLPCPPPPPPPPPPPESEAPGKLPPRPPPRSRSASPAVVRGEISVDGCADSVRLRLMSLVRSGRRRTIMVVCYGRMVRRFSCSMTMALFQATFRKARLVRHPARSLRPLHPPWFMLSILMDQRDANLRTVVMLTRRRSRARKPNSKRRHRATSVL